MAISTVSFAERLSRIEQERVRANGRIVLHVGAEEVMVRSLSNVVPSNSEDGHSSTAAKMIATVLGFIAFAVALAIKTHLLPLATPELALSDFQTGVGVGMALLVGAMLGQLAGVRGRGAWISLMMGVILASMTLHNLAFWAPDQAGIVFTKEWVNLEQTVTAPNSLVFRTQVFAI